MGKASTAKRERRRRADEATRRHAWVLASAKTRGCLFCRDTENEFRSREHVFPESMGNTEIVLSPGVVCDKCNNGVLSHLDKALCDFAPVAMRRTMLGIRSKQGTIPRFRFGQGTLDHIPGSGHVDPTLTFMPGGGREVLREVERHDDGRVMLEWKASGGAKITAKYVSIISRALLKQALECAWLDFGESVFDPSFDHIRGSVLGERRAGFVGIGRKADPNFTGVALSYQLHGDDEGRSHMAVCACYFGAIVLTDSALPRPVHDISADVDVLAFNDSGGWSTVADT